MPRARSVGLRVVPALLAGLLLLAACGDDSESAEATPPPGTGGAVPDPAADERTEPDQPDAAEPDLDESGAAPDGQSSPLPGTDACSLLDVAFLTSTVSFEFGESTWEEQPDPDPNRCRWFNDSKLLTVSVAIDTPDGAAFEDRRANPPSTGTNEDLDDIPGAFAVRDDFGERYYQAWMPADGAVVSLIVDVMQIDDDQFRAVASEVHRRAMG